MEHDLAAGHAALHRRNVVEVAARGQRAQRRDRFGGGLRPRQRVHLVAAGAQLANQVAADEAGAPGDECPHAFPRFARTGAI
jgi:hypothetical protein